MSVIAPAVSRGALDVPGGHDFRAGSRGDGRDCPKPSACRSSRLGRAGAATTNAVDRGRGLDRRTSPRRRGQLLTPPRPRLARPAAPRPPPPAPLSSPPTSGTFGRHGRRGDRHRRSGVTGLAARPSRPRAATVSAPPSPCGRGRRAMADAPSAPGRRNSPAIASSSLERPVGPVACRSRPPGRRRPPQPRISSASPPVRSTLRNRAAFPSSSPPASWYSLKDLDRPVADRGQVLTFPPFLVEP